MNHGADISLVRDIASSSRVIADVFEARPDESYGSRNHGKCLDIVFDRMCPDNLGMIIDCDVAMLKKDWDVTFEHALVGENVIIGTEYDGAKYLGFPNVICAMFRTDVLKELDVSFVPESSGMTGIEGDLLDVYGYDDPDGGRRVSLILDTGSELPRKLKGAGYTGTPLQLYRPSVKEHVDRMKFMQAGMNGEEYQLDGEVYCSHIGRSYTRKFGQGVVERWVDCVVDRIG